ncbi:hypothetical protein J2Z49_001638 [Desulfofundulus luciae]|uniref:Prepilin-type N-terminal cleavage/methylation domain-containing protein n=1 Tax=Desulfofundulus luciae TaxID=74702 RepID=A0ABU0B2M3_9FIRM|nr:prepilin-type N-terminal cleavage/methylation domain-containing protein [Desulfofundulus luciae]MDQ0286524.1 hypothetical protein [Desulfofundulus luciae]
MFGLPDLRRNNRGFTLVELLVVIEPLSPLQCFMQTRNGYDYASVFQT